MQCLYVTDNAMKSLQIGFQVTFRRQFSNWIDKSFMSSQQVLLVTSQFLLKGHKMLNFFVAFCLKISEALEAHISGTETDINRR